MGRRGALVRELFRGAAAGTGGGLVVRAHGQFDASVLVAATAGCGDRWTIVAIDGRAADGSQPRLPDAGERPVAVVVDHAEALDGACLEDLARRAHLAGGESLAMAFVVHVAGDDDVVPAVLARLPQIDADDLAGLACPLATP